MKTIRLNQEQLSDLFIKGECIIGDITIFGSLPYKSDLGPIHKSMEVLSLYEYIMTLSNKFNSFNINLENKNESNEVKEMPFICDVCGEEVSYSERVFKLRNGAEIVICEKCLKDGK